MQKIHETKHISSLFANVQARLETPDETVPEHQYEHYVNLTAKLIKRSYIATAKMVEKWPLDKIIRRYEEVTKHNTSQIPSDVLWWFKRKEDKKRIVSGRQLVK